MADSGRGGTQPLTRAASATRRDACWALPAHNGGFAARLRFAPNQLFLLSSSITVSTVAVTIASPGGAEQITIIPCFVAGNIEDARNVAAAVMHSRPAFPRIKHPVQFAVVCCVVGQVMTRSGGQKVQGPTCTHLLTVRTD